MDCVVVSVFLSIVKQLSTFEKSNNFQQETTIQYVASKVKKLDNIFIIYLLHNTSERHTTVYFSLQLQKICKKKCI